MQGRGPPKWASPPSRWTVDTCFTLVMTLQSQGRDETNISSKQQRVPGLALLSDAQRFSEVSMVASFHSL